MKKMLTIFIVMLSVSSVYAETLFCKTNHNGQLDDSYRGSESHTTDENWSRDKNHGLIKDVITSRCENGIKIRIEGYGLSARMNDYNGTIVLNCPFTAIENMKGDYYGAHVSASINFGSGYGVFYNSTRSCFFAMAAGGVGASLVGAQLKIY